MLRGKRLSLLSAVLGVCCASSALAGGTVTLLVDSSLNETVVQPGDTIDWAISFSVSTGDNQGLAFISVDFTQSATNPAGCCMEHGDDVPAEMSNFSRPLGISNPGEHGHWTGYVGSRRSALGGVNLLQIGGAQNTFGEPGELMGWNTDVETGVGQSGSSQLLLEGSFEAPSSRGVYILNLDGAVANVLDQYDQQNERWNIVEAAIQYNPQNITFIVCPGDVSGDGSVDMSDLAAVLAAQGTCVGDQNYDADADLDSSGCVDQDDLDIVLDNYNTTCE